MPARRLLQPMVRCDLLLMEKKLKHGGWRRASIGEGGGLETVVRREGMERRPTI